MTVSETMALEYTGVNISGGEWGYIKTDRDPVYGVHYLYPSQSELDYYIGRGMNLIRVPFSWEIIQPVPLAPLVDVELSRMTDTVARITGMGAIAVIDPHGFGCYWRKPLGSEEAPSAWFADLWRRLALEFAGNPRVWFGLINEPYLQSAEQWLAIANEAIAEIRATGATNLIAVPGTSWSGAHSWIRSGNDILAHVNDPLDNWIVEAHQYFDEDSSGTHPEVVSETIGSERLIEFTQWCRTNGKRAFLGEFGASDLPGAGPAVRDMLRYMETNRDVWIAFAWWAAGAIWGSYMFGIEPSNDGSDAPQMAYFDGHLQSVGSPD